MVVVPSTLKICGTRHKAKTSETRQGLYHRHCQSPSRHLLTWKCEIWVRDVDFLKPGSNKDSEGEPKIPEQITCQAACAYDIYGKCTGMLSLKRLNILLHAYNQSIRIGLHSTTQPPVQDAATEIAGLLQRYKPN
jgi:hypothetical protein